MAGRSPAMRRVRERLAALSPLRVPVLIAGEGGSGRDSAVEALHALGRHGGRPLVAVRCGVRPQRALLPPRGSSVYLDEVGRLPAAEQARWLGHLGLRGDARTRRVARVYASTSDDLRALAREGSFSPELAEYLSRFRVHLPPLRDRRRDVPELARSLASTIGLRLGRRITGIEEGALLRLSLQPWNGNVAELAGVMEKLVAFSATGEITLEGVGQVLGTAPGSADTPSADTRRAGPTACGRGELLLVFHECGGNLAAAARRLGISRSTLVSRAKRLGLLPRPAAR